MKTIFITDRGMEVPTVNEDQMREIDRIAIEETGPNLLQMMENAGRSLTLQVNEMLGSKWHKARTIVLAGTGGNGGGGICAARHLANRGANVGLVITHADNINSTAAWQKRIFLAAGGTFISSRSILDEKPDLIVDALIGYGLAGTTSGVVVELINWTNSQGVPVLALDIPSGINSSTGDAPGAHIKATRTLTLALPKIGLANPAAGEIVLADIGIPAKAFNLAGIRYETPFEGGFSIPLRRSNDAG